MKRSIFPHNGFRVALVCLAVTGQLLFGALNALAGELVPIPVPKNIIYAGQRIEAHLLKERRVPTRYLLSVSVITRSIEAQGFVARTTLLPNRPIPTNHIMEPDVIKANKPVLMHFKVGMLSISGEMLPLNSAKKGELVRARNLQTGAIISGVAQADGTISAVGR